MSTITILDGELVTQDLADIRVYEFDWDAENLATGVTVPATPPTITATALRPSAATALTLDQKSVVTGNRKTRVRVTGGARGALYRITNQVVTDESSTQTKNKWFDLLIT